MIEPFFVVWNPDHGLPTVKHRNFDFAKQEARGLAATHPDQEFFVLGCVGRAIYREPVEWAETDEIPF